jgi:hypothetical protein
VGTAPDAPFCFAGPPGQAACAFTTKSLHAQNAGAAAVLIVDNRDEGLITLGARPPTNSTAPPFCALR